MKMMRSGRNRITRSRMEAGWSRMHSLIAASVLLIAILLVLMVFAQAKKTMLQGNMLKASANCRSVVLALQRYSLDHGGQYPDGADANQALRELFKQGYISDERDFSAPLSFSKADQSIGQGPDYTNALETGENHWAMTKGVNGQSPASTPLIFENPVSAAWPPRWSVADANKPVPGRAWAASQVESFMGRAPATDWTGHGVFVGRKDGSVSLMPLGEAEGGTATLLASKVKGKNIFEQAGPHEVLDAAKPAATKAADVKQGGAQQEPDVVHTELPAVADRGQARPHKGEILVSMKDPTNKITFVSDSECELENRDGVILGTYTIEGNKIRFAFTIFGSARASYADIYPDGIVMTTEGVHSKGEALLNALGRKQKEEADRAAELEQLRINEEGPKILIGLWKQAIDPPDGKEMEGLMFKDDRTWARVNWGQKATALQGHWGIENGDLNLGLFNVGMFNEGKISELGQDRFVLQSRSKGKIVLTRVKDDNKGGAPAKKEEAAGRMPGEVPSQTQMGAPSSGSPTKDGLPVPPPSLRVTEKDVQVFIAAHHVKSSRGDIAGLIADYDEMVVFLDKGQVPRAFIQAEEENDRGKWPKSGERIVGQPVVVAEAGGRWTATYMIEFYRENVSGAWLSGKIDLRLTLRAESQRLFITGQEAKVHDIKKGKGR